MTWLPSFGSTRSRDAPDMHGCAGLVGAPLLVFCVSVIPHAQREQVGRVLVIRFSVTNDRNRVDLSRPIVIIRTAGIGALPPSRPEPVAVASAPNVWTGCRSQVRWCCRKSLICIRPVDRRAGRGLDGNTHAPLISLADRPSSGHSGHQIQGASIDPFHADPQLRTWSRQQRLV